MGVIYLQGLDQALKSALGGVYIGVTFPSDIARPPLFTVYTNPAGQVGVSWTQAPTAGQQSTASSTIAGYDLSTTGQDVDRKTTLHTLALALLNGTTLDVSTLIRAVADVLVSEENILRRQVIGITSVAWNPASMPNNSGLTSPNVTVTGALFGDFVQVSAPYSLQGITATAYVSAADTVQVRLQNTTGGAIDLASGNWQVVVTRPEVMSPRTLALAKTAITNSVSAGNAD